MTQALDLLTAHFERQRGRAFVVDLGDVGELTIYGDPPTNAESQRIRARAGLDEAKLTLYTVIFLARDKDGKRLFEDNAATVKALTENVAARKLAEIASKLMDITPADDLGN